MACLQPELKMFEILGSDKIVSAACTYIQVTMRYMAIRDFASKDKEHLALQRGDVRETETFTAQAESRHRSLFSLFPVVSSPSLYAIDVSQLVDAVMTINQLFLHAAMVGLPMIRKCTVIQTC